jgi:hypothetical protein
MTQNDPHTIKTKYNSQLPLNNLTTYITLHLHHKTKKTKKEKRTKKWPIFFSGHTSLSNSQKNLTEITSFSLTVKKKKDKNSNKLDILNLKCKA